MPIVRHSRADIDEANLRAKLASQPSPPEAEVEAQATEDGDEWTDEDLSIADLVLPSPSPERIRAVRMRLGLSQSEFAKRFGFRVEAVRQYEQGDRRPSGPAATLLRVIEAAPEVVERALIENHRTEPL
jgi:putative transcriptional regulator